MKTVDVIMSTVSIKYNWLDRFLKTKIQFHVQHWKLNCTPKAKDNQPPCS